MKPAGQVLIVDDDPLVLTILSAFFGSCQIPDVLTASNGKQAVALLSAETNNIRLVVTDINMPEMDGIELLRHLHALDYDGALVLCSASNKANTNSAQKLASAYNLGLSGFIEKPLTKQKLDKIFVPLLMPGSGAQEPG